MHISYFITTSNNPLYNGKFSDGQSFLTFGQHSFLYDLVLGFIDRGIKTSIYIDDLKAFPLHEVFSRMNISCVKISMHKQYSADIIFFDSLSDEYLLNNVYNGLKIGIIHNYMIPSSDLFYKTSDKVLCMTPKAIEIQKKFYDQEGKYVLIRQGIYCNRFHCKRYDNKSIKEVLFYSRMDRHKGHCYREMISIFLKLGIKVSMLGAGELFEQYKMEYKNDVRFIPHVPCYIINDIIHQYDLIISNGRGVMESLASNIHSIAAGVRYCGLINRDNIILNRNANFTGGYLPDIQLDLSKDIEQVSLCFKTDSMYFRHLAINYLDVSMFIDSILSKYYEYVYSR